MSAIDSTSFSRVITINPDPDGWRNARALLLVSCDDNYLHHAVALVRSLEAYSPGCDIMVHLINPGASSVKALGVVASTLIKTRLHISAEQTTLPVDSSLIPYYASARFLRLEELIASADSVAVLALDADAIVVAPIQWDFSDKPEAEVCIRRRDLGQNVVEEHLTVAAGAVWVRPTDASRHFMAAVADEIKSVFRKGRPGWFIDQKIIGRHVASETGGAAIRNIKSKYADWEFRDDSIIWMGKGDRKYLDVRYLLFRESLDESPTRKNVAADLVAMLSDRAPMYAMGSVLSRVKSYALSNEDKAGIFLPRLDLPWKRSGMPKGVAPLLSEDTVELRSWWKKFALEASASFSRAGMDSRIIEIPAWEITPERVDAEGFALCLIPHRCIHDFRGAQTPVWFYMQEYFRSVFVLDKRGWSAASSAYPVIEERLPPAVLGAWDHYRLKFQSGLLSSKFSQSTLRDRDELISSGDIPDAPYIFFPLQIPHDQSLEYFSDIGEMEALEATLGLARSEGLTLVLKAHPANRVSMAPFIEHFTGRDIHWSEANVHDLIENSMGVITLNSGVGFEALLAGMPLVTLARVEYDAVSYKATPGNIAEAWRAAASEDRELRLTRYARFVDWFLGRYAVDLARLDASRFVLDKMVRRIAENIGSTKQ